MFRIITFNANGIRSASRKGFFTWLRTMSPDVLCMQELKAQESDLTDDLRTPLGFHGYFHCAQKKGYSGCGLWSRVNPFAVRTGFGNSEFDAEGRYVEADFGAVIGSLFISRQEAHRMNGRAQNFVFSMLLKCTWMNCGRAVER